jgi:hypothetical protein
MSFIPCVGAAALTGAAALFNYCTKKRPVKELDPSELYHGTTQERFPIKEGQTFDVKNHFFCANQDVAKAFSQEGVSLHRPVASFLPEKKGHPILVQVEPVREDAQYRKGITGANYFVNGTTLKVVKINPVSCLNAEQRNAVMAEREMDFLKMVNPGVEG